MTTEQPTEFLLRVTPQQAGYLARDLNKRLPSHPFFVGPVMATRDNPFDMRIASDANPVHIRISDGSGIDGEVSIMAVPAGAVMRLVNPGHAELTPYWLALLEELRRLECIIEPAPAGNMRNLPLLSFMLDTNADTFANWLQGWWIEPYDFFPSGALHGEPLSRQQRNDGAIILSADAIKVSPATNDGEAQPAEPIEDACIFELHPLKSERVEVTVRYLVAFGFLHQLMELLAEIAKRWPELRDTLAYPSYGHWSATEAGQAALDDLGAWLDRLKGRQKLALQGHNATGALFYLDKTTAREAATWLTENWRRRNHEPANVWTWPTDYHHGRRYQTTPIQEATDGAGRVLLTVGIVECETHHPNPLSVPFGPLAIPQDQFTLVQDNPRGLEILLIQAGSDLVQVEARCNAVLLLHSFTQLLRNAKTAYGERLRLFAPSFRGMDAARRGEHEMMNAYCAARAEEFRELVIAIEPKFARLLGGTARADDPAVIGGGETTAAQPEAARADDTDPDSIPRWGRRRDLSTHEVRNIVKRCKDFQQLPGGSIAKFHDQESQKWPDPDDAPKGYSLKTLQSWVPDPRFQ